MPFPRRLLIQGEELVLDLRPHWVALVWPSILTTLLLVGYVLLLVNAPGDGAGRSVAVWGGLIVALVLFVWFPLRAFVYWATSNFAVTSDRIIHRQGFIAKRSMEIPLEAINDVRFSQNIFERVVGAGDLIIQSASEYGQNVFSNIRNPEHVQRVIYEQGEANKRRMYQGVGGAPPSPSVTTELERLADLRDRGVLTEAEFQDQKKKILGR